MTPTQIIDHFGKDHEDRSAKIKTAAKAIGMTPGIIYHWLKVGKVPPKTQAWIQVETGGALKAAQGGRR